MDMFSQQKKGKRQIVFISLYVILFIFTAWVDGYVYPEKNLAGLYFFNIIFAGIVFRGNISIQILIVALLTFLYFYFAPFQKPSISVIIFQGLTYTLAILSIHFAYKYKIQGKENELNVTIALAKSLDSRDPYTACHSENVAHYAVLIAKELMLPQKQCEAIYTGGLLHDIGKIGVPEMILTKQGRLTAEEYELIKQHPEIGYNMVKHISSFRRDGILDMILYHHERYDGKGYPQRLAGENIPRVARIMAVADSFDAMISRRAYRPQSDVSCALEEIRKHTGTQFDPVIADVFIGIVERMGEDVFPQNGKQTQPTEDN